MERYIPIPEPVREYLTMWRPTPLVRARRLEQALGTPARIYYKNEGVSPVGSHKPNTAVPRPTTTRSRAPSGSPPRPAPASGAARWPWPAISSAWSARCSWSR
jgi:predicted alternative tryptophan synthase beta-subunit